MPTLHHRRPLALALVACLGIFGTSAMPARASELVLGPDSGHVIEGRVNHQVVRLRVDPETPGYLILNGAAAFRLRLFPTSADAATIIGPVRVHGATRSARVQVGGVTSTRQVVWTEREAAAGADGIISPADLPFDRVTLRFHDPEPGEQVFNLPMRFDPALGLYHSMRVGDGLVHFRFSTARRYSLATAAAGALMVNEYGGGWSGGPQNMMIKYGVVRPVRLLALDRPLMVAGQPLAGFLVRTSDHRGSALLPSDPSADPDEIVVTASIERQRARFLVSLGLDWLGRCSSMTWDNVERRLLLSCPASGGGGRTINEIAKWRLGAQLEGRGK